MTSTTPPLTDAQKLDAILSNLATTSSSGLLTGKAGPLISLFGAGGILGLSFWTDIAKNNPTALLACLTVLCCTVLVCHSFGKQTS
jgi:hypothetical protein